MVPVKVSAILYDSPGGISYSSSPEAVILFWFLASNAYASLACWLQIDKDIQGIFVQIRKRTPSSECWLCPVHTVSDFMWRLYFMQFIKGVLYSGEMQPHARLDGLDSRVGSEIQPHSPLNEVFTCIEQPIQLYEWLRPILWIIFLVACAVQKLS